MNRTGLFAVSSILALVVLLHGTGTPAAASKSKAGRVGNSLGPNYRLYPSNVTQTETFITRHPSDPSILFASANTINLATGFTSEGIYVTTDGGTAWFGSDTCSGANINFHRGDPGIAIDKNGRFVLIRLSDFPIGLFSHYSTDNGRTWSSQRTVATNDQDRATLVSDGNPASQYYGRTYAAWVRLDTAMPTAAFSYTDDGAQNWSPRANVNSPTQRGQGGELAMGPGGSVHLCWAGVTDVSPYTEDFVGYAKTTSGGASWTVVETAFDINGIAGAFATKANIRVNGLPRIDIDKTGGQRQGWIYIVTTQKNLSPAGSDPDIVLNRSTDGGQTWSAGIRVNQDPLNNGKYQFFPAIHVDDFGGVNVLFYDDRATTSDSSGVLLARSTDGGDSWNEYQVSNHNFKPQPIGGLGQGYQGDNIGLTSVGQTLWPVWMDNSTGIYQIWTSPIDLTLLSIDNDLSSIPEISQLHQNFPNPFNPSTTIEYDLATSGDVNLRVIDVSGRIVLTLLNGWQQTGRHRVRFDTRDLQLSSGIYFYQLSFSGRTATKAMVFLK